MVSSDSPPAFNAADKSGLLRQLQWRSRRGMLELDLLLLPFAQRALPDLNEAQMRLYGRLMDAEDRELVLWLQRGREDNMDPAFRPLLRHIRQYVRSPR